jgi:hypothetical protein
MEKDLSWFVTQRSKKQQELQDARKKARLLNKEIRNLNKTIADNLKDIILVGTKNPIDDENYGWVVQATEELNDGQKKNTGC